MTDRRVTVITGASSGIGLAAAKLFLDNGDKVYCLSRRSCPIENVISIPCDITDDSAVQSSIKEIISQSGQIDVLICNAGFGISGSVEFTDVDSAVKQFDVNFFGAVRCIHAVLPYMRTQTAGRIIVTSSVAGVIAIPFQAYYSATKAALNSLVLSLANEVKPFGIKLSAVMPGDIQTEFTAARDKITNGEDCYSAMRRSVETMEHDERTGMMPIAIAKKMYSLSVKKHPKPLSTVGIKYKACCLLIRLLPIRLANLIVGRIYAC